MNDVANITAKEFISTIHSEADKYAVGVILKYWPPSCKYMEDIEHPMSDRYFKVIGTKNSFAEAVQYEADNETEDAYFSINAFRKNTRLSEDLWNINAFVIDYDYYKIKKYESLSPQDMYRKHIKPSLKMKPTFVVDSGRGLYVIYKFEKNSKKRVRFYQTVYRELIKSQAHFGADMKASLVTQVIRIPGTLNTRTGRYVEVFEVNETNYKIEDFTFCLPYTYEEVTEYKKNKVKPNHSVTVSARATVNKVKKKEFVNTKAGRIIEDLKTLIKIRNKAENWEGYREELIYIARNAMHVCGYKLNEEIAMAMQLNNMFSVPLPRNEVIKRCKPSCPANIHKISTIIDVLEITEEEQCNLKTLCSDFQKKKNYLSYLKYERSHKILNMSDDDIRIHKRRCEVLKLYKKGKNKATIARILNTAKSTITNDLDYIETHKYQFIESLKETLDAVLGRLEDVSFVRSVTYTERLSIIEWAKTMDILLE